MLRASRIRAIASFLVVFLCFGVVGAQPAHADDGQPAVGQTLNADQAKRLADLPADQRNAIRDDMNRQLAKMSCGNFWLPLAMTGADCEQVAAAAYETFLTTPEKAMAFNPKDDGKTFCAALAQVKAPMSAIGSCTTSEALNNFLPVLGAATRVALQLSPGGQFVLGTVDTVAFIANAKDGFEKFSNTVKGEAVKSTNEVMNNLLKTSALSMDDEFRNTWAAFAAVGIVVLALMYFKLWKDVSNEDVDLEEAQKSLFWYGPLSIILVLFGPAIGYQLNSWISGLTEAFTGWTAGHIATFMEVIARFASYQSNGVFGPLVAVVVYGLLFLGAWGLLAMFFLQPFALYLMGVGIAVMIGFMIHPEYRQRVAKTGTLWIAIGLSKPVLVLLMGAVFTFISTRPAFQGGGTDDAMVNAASVFMAGSAMLLLAFSPALLFKFVPLLPSSATGVGAGRESVAGAAMVAGAGAGVDALIRNRRIAHNRSADPGTNRGSSTPSTPSGNAGGSGQGTEPGPDGRNIGQLQRDARTGRSGSAQDGAGQDGAGQEGAGQGRRSGAVVRGSGKIAAGGAAAFLLAGRETARQAGLRGKRSTGSMVPDTDHISGR
ncbi:hypothetical protein [Arthrobacter bambusae]|uniref:hypothetical protein n=1 Tax=Arthrobacter bambusae TaxID=1338426 RepID=UPI0027869EA6|nr:hypothetical protein [Arthrobacter bambusae]MDQ0212145.1 hypothetical protein [Arthrobacter bambusae]MDQ0236637.1 hypothetical protein [Arthrobacter bambusae]